MNKLIAIAALSALAGSAYAQLPLPLPPSSVADGVPLLNYNPGPNTGVTHWDNPLGLAAYKFASDDNLNIPNMDSPDNRLGLTWAAGKPAQVIANKAAIEADGGTIRTIFTGESAGWLNDLGYTYTGHPGGAGNFTVVENIQALSPATISFGQYFNNTFTAHSGAAAFDVWLNAVGETGVVNAPPGNKGGVYTIFDTTNSIPYIAPGNVLWAQSPILVSTWIGLAADTVDGTADGYTNVQTWLVGIEDWRRGHPDFDGDYNDLMLAFQFFDKNGRPFGPVPEPSTYGLLGAIALGGLVAFRRFKAKK